MAKEGKERFFLGALVGAVAGAVAGILFAPKSGKETRKMIGNKAKECTEDSEEMLEKGAEIVKNKIKETTEMAKDKVKETADSVSKKMDK